MIIKCQKCGHENQHTSIFCRKCGVKIDKKQMEEAIQKTKKSNIRRNRIGSIVRLVKLIIVIAILYVVFCIFYPAFFPPKRDIISDKETISAAKRLQSTEYRNEDSYSFTPAEITALYNEYFISKNLNKNPLIINIDKDDVTFSIRKKAFNFLPVDFYLTIEGKPCFNVTNDGRSEKLNDFEISKVKIGYLNIPKPASEYIIKIFKPYFNKKTAHFLGKIENIEIDKDTGFTVFMKSRK